MGSEGLRTLLAGRRRSWAGGAINVSRPEQSLGRRFNKEAFEDGDLSATERYLAPDFLNHVSGKRGAKDMKRIIRYVRDAFPDGRQDVDLEIAEGDLVVELITSTGTHTGEVAHTPGDRSRRPVDACHGRACGFIGCPTAR